MVKREISYSNIYYFGICYVDFHDGEYIINALSVFSRYQNKGTGTFLMKSTEEFIRKLNGNKAILYVEEGTWQADWYKRLGYKISDIQDRCNKYVRMGKELKIEL